MCVCVCVMVAHLESGSVPRFLLVCWWGNVSELTLNECGPGPTGVERHEISFVVYLKTNRRLWPMSHKPLRHFLVSPGNNQSPLSSVSGRDAFACCQFK